jgi:hypothetical protein
MYINYGRFYGQRRTSFGLLTWNFVGEELAMKKRFLSGTLAFPLVAALGNWLGSASLGTAAIDRFPRAQAVASLPAPVQIQKEAVTFQRPSNDAVTSQRTAPIGEYARKKVAFRPKSASVLPERYGRGVDQVVDSQVRREVSDAEVDAVIFRKGGHRRVFGAELANHEGHRVNSPEPISEASASAMDSRWLNSDETAKVQMGQRKETQDNCRNSQESCNSEHLVNGVPLVGVVIKSAPESDSVEISPMRGELNLGSQADRTPAFYIQ